MIISRKLIRNICSDNNNNNVANINIYEVIYIYYICLKRSSYLFYMFKDHWFYIHY